jgi:hypothetical protein
VVTLPRGQRVVASLDVLGSHINPLGSVQSRACIGRCFDFGNYEASSLQFRVRANTANSVVAASVKEVEQIGNGTHVVTAQEAPLYSLCASAKPGARLELRKLVAGESTCRVDMELPSHPWATASQ